MIEQRVTLRYGAQQIPAIVQAVQGDTGRDVIFELADYEIPAGATANYYIDKPDGNAVYNSAEVISSTEILAHLTEQALAAPGRNNGQVRILSDGEVITSFDFVLEVEAFRGILRLQSETEVNIFDEALQAAADSAIAGAVEEIQAQTPVVTGMQNSIAPTYSASSTYAVGDYVIYNAQLYKCNTAITTAEAWTASHWTQISLSGEVINLKSAIEPLYMQFIDLNTGTEGKYWNSSLNKANSGTYCTIEPFHVDAGTYYKDGFSSGFCWFKSDADGTVSNLNNFGDPVVLPSSGSIYISANFTMYDKTLWKFTNFDLSIFKNTEILPFGILSDIVTKRLFEKEANIYDLIHDVNENKYFTKIYAFGGSTISGNVVTAQEGAGFSTNNFISNSGNVFMDFDITADCPTGWYLAVLRNDNTVKYVRYEDSPAGHVHRSLHFDASSYIVYENAKEFYGIVVCGSEGTITVNEISIYEKGAYSLNDLYDNKFTDMMLKIFSAIDNNSGAISSISSHPTVYGQDGDMYRLTVGLSGQVVAVKTIPDKIIFMGNSITCGMDNSGQHGGMFGMAATAFNKDWVYYVYQAILEKNQNATYKRLYSSPFEHELTIADAREWISSIIQEFDSSTDLVVIEIGDNVNTAEKENVFVESFPELIESIYNVSPGARIVIAGIWFNKSSVMQILTENARRYGCDFVNISSLHTAENEATVGDTVTYLDGTTSTITEGIATHPGDLGMQAIASAIIERLAM